MGCKKQANPRPRTHGPVRLVFDPDAHRAMESHCNGTPEREVCGVLVGFTGEDDHGRWTRVVAIIEGRHAREDQMSVTFTHETWDVVHTCLARRTDKARVIGWYHTHPNFGIFYSAPDLFVHRNFFGLAGQVGVVVDPVRNERGVFANIATGITVLERYEVARLNRSGHLVRCAYNHDPLAESLAPARAAAEATSTAGLSDPNIRSALDSIEATLARIERQSQVRFRIALAASTLLAVLGFGTGVFYGQRRTVIEIPRSLILPDRAPAISGSTSPSTPQPSLGPKASANDGAAPLAPQNPAGGKP
jgi:proteasome lid subunit RPN8/RPN11